MERQHEQQISRRVDQGGKDEKIQGTLAVAHRPQDARAHIVEHQPADAHKIDAQIGGGLGHHVFGSPHQPQKGGGQQHPGQGDHHGQKQRDGDGGVHRVVHIPAASRAEGPGDHHRGARGKAVEEAQQRIDQRARGAHGGQSLGADKIAHHDGVHRVVQLLKNEAEQHGRGKGNKLPGDVALGHIHGAGRTHTKIPPCNAHKNSILPFFALCKGVGHEFSFLRIGCLSME